MLQVFASTKPRLGSQGSEAKAREPSFLRARCQGEKGSVCCNKDGKCYGDCPSCGDNPDTTKGGGTVEGVLSGATLKAGSPTKSAQTPEPKQVQEPTQKPVAIKPIATMPIENHAEKPIENHSDKHPRPKKVTSKSMSGEYITEILTNGRSVGKP